MFNAIKILINDSHLPTLQLADKRLNKFRPLVIEKERINFKMSGQVYFTNFTRAEYATMILISGSP